MRPRACRERLARARESLRSTRLIRSPSSLSTRSGRRRSGPAANVWPHSCRTGYRFTKSSTVSHRADRPGGSSSTSRPPALSDFWHPTAGRWWSAYAVDPAPHRHFSPRPRTTDSPRYAPGRATTTPLRPFCVVRLSTRLARSSAAANKSVSGTGVTLPETRGPVANPVIAGRWRNRPRSAARSRQCPRDQTKPTPAGCAAWH